MIIAKLNILCPNLLFLYLSPSSNYCNNARNCSRSENSLSFCGTAHFNNFHCIWNKIILFICDFSVNLLSFIFYFFIFFRCPATTTMLVIALGSETTRSFCGIGHFNNIHCIWNKVILFNCDFSVTFLYKTG